MSFGCRARRWILTSQCCDEPLIDVTIDGDDSCELGGWLERLGFAFHLNPFARTHCHCHVYDQMRNSAAKCSVRGVEAVLVKRFGDSFHSVHHDDLTPTVHLCELYHCLLCLLMLCTILTLCMQIVVVVCVHDFIFADELKDAILNKAEL